MSATSDTLEQQLVDAIDAGYRAAETCHHLMQSLTMRVQKLENAGSSAINDELQDAHWRIDEILESQLEAKQSHHRRIADLELRIEDLERDLGNANKCIADHQERMEHLEKDQRRVWCRMVYLGSR
jgi:predicted  nucleic acid-binding Zn-ribbon protein